MPRIAAADLTIADAGPRNPAAVLPLDHHRSSKEPT